MTPAPPRHVSTRARAGARRSDPRSTVEPSLVMRRLAALIMLLGAATAALGVVAVVGVERIDLPPAQVRAIAAAIPVAILVLGVVLLLIGAIVARLALREGHAASSAERAAATPGLGEGRPAEAAERLRARDRVT